MLHQVTLQVTICITAATFFLAEQSAILQTMQTWLSLQVQTDVGRWAGKHSPQLRLHEA